MNKIKKPFTVFSNNCWGGISYDRLGKQYSSPTIGLLIRPSDYLLFLENIDYFLNQTPCRCNDEDTKMMLTFEGREIPLFLTHYASSDDGVNKWERRKKRICFNNIIVKLSDSEIRGDFLTNELVERFSILPYKKIMFTSNVEWAKKYDFAIFVKAEKGYDRLTDSKYELKKVNSVYSMKQLIELINQ